MANPLRQPLTFTPNYWADRVAILRATVARSDTAVDPVLLENALEGAESVLRIEADLADQPLVGWTYNDDEISDLVAARSSAQALAVLQSAFPERDYLIDCIERVEDHGFPNRKWCFEEKPAESFTWAEFIRRINLPRHLAGVYF
ncbi:hypothetical protein EAH72_33495 [Pseudomonas caspiana]|nr:hypothetical protein [Pseudomonas caspiana]TPG88273.1 hypothetical protein EAH72_33495 [Pseudomonas caspiana]